MQISSKSEKIRTELNRNNVRTDQNLKKMLEKTKVRTFNDRTHPLHIRKLIRYMLIAQEMYRRLREVYGAFGSAQGIRFLNWSTIMLLTTQFI